MMIGGRRLMVTCLGVKERPRSLRNESQGDGLAGKLAGAMAHVADGVLAEAVCGRWSLVMSKTRAGPAGEKLRSREPVATHAARSNSGKAGPEAITARSSVALEISRARFGLMDTDWLCASCEDRTCVPEFCRSPR